MSVNEIVSHCPEDSDYNIESGFHCYSPFLERQIEGFFTLSVSTIGNDSWIQRSGEVAASIDVSGKADEFKLAA